MTTWGAPAPTFDEVLVAWERAKLTLNSAKENEMTLRKKAFEMGFGANAREGTNTETLGGGYDLKGVRKFNYKLQAPAGINIDVETAVDNVVKAMTRISNEGSFLADRLFQWSVSLSVPEYKLLVEHAKDSMMMAAMLDAVNTVVLITDAAPTLEIKAPKKGK